MSEVWSTYLPAGLHVGTSRVALRARGVEVTYADGSRRLCATSGLWNAPLGYGVESIAEAVAEALRESSYLTLFRRSHQKAEDSAARLLALGGRDYRRVIYSTSGGAALDAAMKLARQYWVLGGESARRNIVAVQDSYHGTMLGSHALSGSALGQAAYGLDRRSIRHVVTADGGHEIERLMSREGHRVAAVVIEPVLGNGAVPLSEGFLESVQLLRERFGFLLVADEVATGFWRTGPVFASDRWSVKPDILVTSKALTNGTMAAAAILVGSRVTKAFDGMRAVFVHGETQAGTPPVCAAIDATLSEFERLDPARAVTALGKTFSELLEAQLGDMPGVCISGRGLFLAIHLTDSAGNPWGQRDVDRVIVEAAQLGVDLHPGPGCVQLIPAFVMQPADARRVVTTLAAAVRVARRSDD